MPENESGATGTLPRTCVTCRFGEVRFVDGLCSYAVGCNCPERKGRQGGVCITNWEFRSRLHAASCSDLSAEILSIAIDNYDGQDNVDMGITHKGLALWQELCPPCEYFETGNRTGVPARVHTVDNC
jgi:hypothetical protein